MSLPRMALVLTAYLPLVGGAQIAWAYRATGKNTPIPAQAKVSIELDQGEYFLGENVLFHFLVENTGKEPFSIEMGGDYRGASRHLRFKVKALDAAGKLCADPDPSDFCMGGIGYSP